MNSVEDRRKTSRITATVSWFGTGFGSKSEFFLSLTPDSKSGKSVLIIVVMKSIILKFAVGLHSGRNLSEIKVFRV